MLITDSIEQAADSALFHNDGTTGLIVQPDTNSPSSKPIECNDKV